MKGRFLDPLSPNLRTEGNFQARFFRRKSIVFNKLYRLTSSFFVLRKYFDTHFWGQCVMPGVVWWLYGQNLPYKFKNSYSDLRKRNFKKSHRTTGPRSDLRPDLWSCANLGLDSTFSNVETESFWVTSRGFLREQTVVCMYKRQSLDTGYY
jgi:hypothetical protein